MKQSIWRITGFLPYVVVVFLNAFTDLGHKIVIQNTVFKIYDGETQIVLTAIVNALILLPFILLFSPSGFIADRYPKSLVMRISAAIAIAITLVITASYYLGLFELAFAMTFLLAVQSAIYSPAKYGYIKELVGSSYITMGNGVVQAVTTVAILGGILAYSILFEARLEGVEYSNSAEILRHIAPLGWALVLGSVLEFLLTYRLPNTHVECHRRFELPKYIRLVYLRENLRLLRKKEIIFVSILGLSLFWGISQVVLSSFPEYAKNSIGIDNTVIVQGMMAVAGLGIVIGSLVAGKVSRNRIEIGTIPLGALGITLSLLLLPLLEHPLAHGCNFFLFGVASGLFIVPLNSLIQYHSEAHELGMVLAGNNFMQNVVMFTFLLMTVLFALMGLGSVGLFYLMLLFAAVGTVYLILKIPQSLVEFIILRTLALRFRLKVLDFDRFPQSGAVLMLGNHISWVDWALVQMAVPRRVRFVMDRAIYERWYLKWFLDIFGAIPISSRGMKQAIRDVEARLKQGEVVCLFPEGTISRNGHLGSFKHGFEKMVGEADGVIVPFYLRGLWGDPLSRSSSRLKRLKRSHRSEVIFALGEAMPIHSRAEEVKQRIFELSCSSWQEYSDTMPTLSEAWVERAKDSSRIGTDAYCIVEWGGTKIGHLEMLVDTLLFARRMRDAGSDTVGVLMPAGSTGAMINIAALMAGKRVVNLDYSAPEEALHHTITESGIERIYTTARFLKRVEAKGLAGGTIPEESGIVDIEAVRSTIGRAERIATHIYARVAPAALLKRLSLEKCGIDDVAVIHFGKDTAGEYRGVMLTHRNLMANIAQLFDLLNVREEDVMLATLPLYRSMGLTTGLLLPLIHGIPVACYPEPLNARGVGRTAARYETSIFFGTPELFHLYTRSRQLHPLMFATFRLVFSSQERLEPSVREAFEERFGQRIYEGYCLAESTAVASLNLPDILETNEFTVQVGSKAGSVGMPLPGTAFRIVDPETMRSLPYGHDGLILVGGAQVMQGYLNAPDQTRSVLLEEDGLRWCRSGESGHLDEEGFLFLSERKRKEQE